MIDVDAMYLFLMSMMTPHTVYPAGRSIRLCVLFLLFAFACQDVHNHNSVSTLNKH